MGLSLHAPDGTRGRDLSVSFRKGAVTVGLKRAPAAPPLFSAATLCEIVPDGCGWSLERGCVLLTLEKRAHNRFWRCVSDGHAEMGMPDWWPHIV